MRRSLLLVLLVVSLVAPNAFAWGKGGHIIVARLAQDRLSNDAEGKMREILGSPFIANNAADPDTWRRNQGAQLTANWHFVNIPLDEETYDADRDCGGSQCVVAQIGAMRDVLADTAQKPEVRREALIYLVHFVGDLHQPFHCGSGTLANGRSDLGGNLVNVKINGQNDNLHHVWDATLLETRDLNAADYVQHLVDEVLAGRDPSSLNGGTPEEWANESHAIAISEKVDNNATLDEAYVEKNVETVDERLLLAGLRLARLIEEALGGEN